MKILISLSLCIILNSCTAISDKNIEQPLVISIIDLQEADYVRDSLSKTSGSKGAFRVEAGSTTTTAYFKFPDKPVNEQALRQSMRELKADLTRHRGREANTLEFVFPSKTVIE